MGYLAEILIGMTTDSSCPPCVACLLCCFGRSRQRQLRATTSILDSGAEGRNTTIQMLLSVAQREQSRSSQSLSVVWTEGGQQRALEEALSIGEFDYPALVVLNQKKQVRPSARLSIPAIYSLSHSLSISPSSCLLAYNET